jgi:hypothetical protein
LVLLSEDNATQWCAARGLLIEDRQLRLPDGHGRYRVGLPREYKRALKLVDCVLPEAGFQGGMLWLREYELWSETASEDLFKAIRKSYVRDAMEIFEKRAQVFDLSDYAAAYLSALIPILAGWDAYYIPDRADYVYFISHAAFIEMRFRDIEAANGVCSECKAQNFECEFRED